MFIFWLSRIKCIDPRKMFRIFHSFSFKFEFECDTAENVIFGNETVRIDFQNTLWFSLSCVYMKDPALRRHVTHMNCFILCCFFISTYIFMKLIHSTDKYRLCVRATTYMYRVKGTLSRFQISMWDLKVKSCSQDISNVWF